MCLFGIWDPVFASLYSEFVILMMFMVERMYMLMQAHVLNPHKGREVTRAIWASAWWRELQPVTNWWAPLPSPLNLTLTKSYYPIHPPNPQTHNSNQSHLPLAEWGCQAYPVAIVHIPLIDLLCVFCISPWLMPTFFHLFAKSGAWAPCWYGYLRSKEYFHQLGEIFS